MRTMRLVLGFLIVALASGCSTGYRKTGFRGGYSETQLAEDVWRVTFRGNGYTQPEKGADFALLRCAEIAKAQGYRFFVLIDEKTRLDRTEGTIPGAYHSTTTKTGPNTYSSTMTGGPSSYVIIRPNSTNTMLLLKEKPPGSVAFEAAMVIKSVKKKYRLR